MSTTNAASKIAEAASLADVVHTQIRNQILDGHYMPGAPLRDSVLAKQLGISRSPVREALRMLEQSGLVRKALNRSYRVASLNASDVAELAVLRVADETLALRVVVNTRVSLSPLRARLDELSVAWNSEKDRDVIAADTAFHVQLIELAALPRLTSRYARLTDLIHLSMVVGELHRGFLRRGIVERHQVLLDCLTEAQETGNAREVVAAWEQHVLLGTRIPSLIEPL